MTIITRKHLARRTFLGGMGAALALPMLDSMAPAFAAPGVKAPTRLLFTYIPSGATMADWIPNAGLLIEPDVSHFAFIQDSDQFTRDVRHFLENR